MKPWKIQKFAGDVIWDLRNRGLLPVVALLVVAMVVIPVMISRQAKKAPPADASLAAAAVDAPEGTSAVLAYNPGVRDYKKRLQQLAEKDPFVQHFTSSASSDQISSTVSSTVGTVDTSSTVTDTVKVNDGGGNGGGGDSKTIVKTKYVGYALDLAVGEVGSLKTMRDVEPLSFLPSEPTPVLVFLGLGGEGSKALFLVSSDVSAASGEGSCVPSGSSPCDMLVMRPGQVEDFSYDPDGKTYRLKVTGIRKTVRTVTG